jgi:hypothetical protein
MVFQFIRLAGKFSGSKILLLPAIGIAFVSVATLSLTYTTTRAITSRLLAVKFEQSSTICQTTTSGLAAIPTLSYIGYRHYRYEPLSIDAITAAIEEQAKQDGLLNQRHQPSTSNTQRRVDVQDLYYRITQNSRVYQQYIAQPLKFYAINLWLGAAIMGSATAVAQRIVCGRTNATTRGNTAVTKEKANGVTVIAT